MLNSEPDYGITLLGPMRPNVSWQANIDGSYDLSKFRINWKAQKVTCPQGKKSRSWSEGKDMAGRQVFHVKFSTQDCRQCTQRPLCTRCESAPRHLMIRPQQEHKALEAIRRQQQTKK
jgi:transposase